MGSGTAEAVAGELVDASEHYEDAPSLVHEDPGSDAGQAGTVGAEQDADGQHLKGYDHCAHTHGASVGAPALPAPRVTITPVPTFVDLMVRPPDAPAGRLYHPPRA